MSGRILGLLVLLSTAAEAADLARPQDLCEAPILAPAEQREGSIQVVTRPAMTRFDIIPARLQAATRQIETRAAVTVLQTTKPALLVESRRALIRPQETRWVRDSLDGKFSLSSGERADIEASGVSLADVKPGQCVHEFHVPPVLGQRRHRVLVQEASETYQINEAVFQQQIETITLVPAYRRLIEVPPVIRDVESRLRVRFAESAGTHSDRRSTVAYRAVSQPAVETPAMITEVMESAKTKDVPVWRIVTPASITPLLENARFDTVTEHYTQVEPRFVWRIGSVPAARSKLASSAAGPQDSSGVAESLEAVSATARATGRKACLRKLPAFEHRYEFTRVIRPAEVHSRVAPARFQRIDVEEKHADAQAVPREMPAQMATRRVTVDLPPASMGSTPIVCAADVDRSLVRQVQAALHQVGFDPGVVDGLSGPATLGALADYEETKGLDVTGKFALQTLQRLGLRATVASAD